MLIPSLFFMLQLTIFLLAFVTLAGAWMGFWAVRKLVLTEEGSVDISTSIFVAWSIRILAVIMILQVELLPPILKLFKLTCIRRLFCS